MKNLLLFIMALLPFQQGHDVGNTTVSGTIFCQEGKRIAIPLGGAELSLVAGKDTLHTTSDELGRYSFSTAKTFEVTILAKYQGYEDFKQTYQLFDSHTAIAINMKRSMEQLDAAKIKSEIPFVRKDADTTIYNMAALEKMDGDRALRLVLQIPGFEIIKGKLTVWGEVIDKTYVNGRLIYGDDPMSALNLLNADEIKNVRVYDTQRMEDIQRGLKNSKKRRVIDIQTFQQFLAAVDVQAQTRAGAVYDMNEAYDNPLRYSAGVNFDSNREMQQIEAVVNSNNINDSRNGLEVTKCDMPALHSDQKQTGMSFSIAKKWKDAEWGNSLSASYEYNHENCAIRDGVSEIDRIGTDSGILPLRYESVSSSEGINKFHEIRISANLHSTPFKDVKLGTVFKIDDSQKNNLSKMWNDAGATGTQSQCQVSSIESRRYHFNQRFTWSNPYAKNGWVPAIHINYNVSNNEFNETNIDTLMSSSIRRNLEGSGDEMRKYFLGTFSLKKALKNTGYITTGMELWYQTEYTERHNEKSTIDHLLPEREQTDFVNSFDYNWHAFRNSIMGVYSVSARKHQLIKVIAGLTAEKIKDIETFPTEIRTDNSFVTPSIQVSSTPPIRRDKLIISYTLQGIPPASESMRKRINNLNPLRLTMGNPDLKRTVNQTVGVNYIPHILPGGASFALQCLVNIDHNPVVSKINYYSSPGTLSAWGVDYSIPAGGTLTEFVNASYSLTSDFMARFDCRIKPLKGTLKSEFSLNYRRLPEYDFDMLNFMTGTSPRLSLSLTTMPVKCLRLTLSSSTSYNKDINTYNAVLSESVVESCSATAELRFLKNGFCDARYSATIYNYLSGMGTDTDIHNLTCSVGSFFLKGKLAVSISGSDLLGKAFRYSTSTTGSEFIRFADPSVGRYCLLNVAYRFSKKH